MSKFTFGSDPEFMLKKGDEYVSAIPIVNASNKDPIVVNDNRFYWDNVLAECAVKPASSKEEAVENHREALKAYVNIVSPAKLVIQASQEYPDSAMKEKEALIAGCKFDNCAYTMRKMKGELSASSKIQNSNFRTCGGHIHLGQESGLLIDGGPEVIFAVYLMDLFIGVPSIFIDKDPTSIKRRTLYGEAGRHRIKPYGFEYRSLSSFWLNSPKLLELIYDISNFILEILDNQDILNWDENLYFQLLADEQSTGDSFSFKDFNKKELKQCIDQSDKRKAKFFVSYLEKKIPKDLYLRIQKEMFKRKSYDMYKEWSL